MNVGVRERGKSPWDGSQKMCGIWTKRKPFGVHFLRRALVKKESVAVVAKQQNSWAFFVNAAGDKEDPIVIGKSTKPRCFRNMNDMKRPYNCHYFANQKPWIYAEVMNEVSFRLNPRLRRNKRRILFMNNARSHQEILQKKIFKY